MSPQLSRYHRIAQKNRALGLTAHGSRRQRQAKLTPEQRREYGTAKFRRRTERLYEQGLTTRGTQRKRWNFHGHIRGAVTARVAIAVTKADQAKAIAHARVNQMLKEAA